MEKLLNYFIDNMFRFGQRIKKNPRVRNTIYRMRNEQLFGNIDQHERMLADQVRIDTYHAAIKKYVAEGDSVLDLGSGTGVLSFFASQNKPKVIHAIDHGAIIDLAKYLAVQNEISNINFFHAHSNQFQPEEKVDIIIHEQIGDFLLDEDMVRNICDLRDRVLAPGGKILPNRFDLFLEPAALNPSHRTSFLWEHHLHGVSFEGAREWLESDLNKIGKTKSHHRLLPGAVSHLMCNPESFLSFDLLTVDPDRLPKKFTFNKKIINPGLVDGFCLYFHIHFDEELNIKTDPFSKPTHWANQIFRIDPTYCRAGDAITIDLEMGDYTKVSSWKLAHTIDHIDNDGQI